MEESRVSFEYSVSLRQAVVLVCSKGVMFLVWMWIVKECLVALLGPFVSPDRLWWLIYFSWAFSGLLQALHLARVLLICHAVAPPKHRSERTPRRVVMATTLVPSKEFDLLPRKLEAMRDIRCSDELSLVFWVLDEGNDQRVKDLIVNFCRENQTTDIRHFSRSGKPEFNQPSIDKRNYHRFQEKQKAGNINAFLSSTDLSDFDLVTFIDLDHLPLPSFYETIVPFFEDPSVSFVQAPETFYNRDATFISRSASFERDEFFGVLCRSFYGAGLTIIVGAHTTFRTAVFTEVLQMQYPTHIAEDFLIAMKLAAAGKHGVFTNQIVAHGELPTTWDVYLGQQDRWATAGLDLLFRYLPSMFWDLSWKHLLTLASLLTYYLWGIGAVVVKWAGPVLALVGVEMSVDLYVLGAITFLGFSSGVFSYYWNKQFYIIEEKDNVHFLDHIPMIVFLGVHFAISFFQAVLFPVQPFRVTAKSTHGVKSMIFSRLGVSVIALLLDAILCGIVFLYAPINASNLLLHPLLVFMTFNLLVLGGVRLQMALERTEKED